MGSVYVHIPYCLSKCGYCGFNSRPARSGDEIDHYCLALISEIESRREEVAGFSTIYFGGGTPSLASIESLGRVLQALGWGGSSGGRTTEVTIEVNPGTADRKKIKELKEAGFNRLSIGVQSFDDEMLQRLGRAHDAKKAADLVKDALMAGFDNIGLDLIYALPCQTLANWEGCLERAMDLEPKHLSLYSLTYEQSTEFDRLRREGRMDPCDEDLETEMYLLAIEKLSRKGFQHYEVSNFARPGYSSRHNLNYWKAGDYAGFGAGAHSHKGERRWSNISDPGRYVSALKNGTSPIEMEEKLSVKQQIFEALFLGMRMVEGIEIGEFKNHWGTNPQHCKPEVWERWQKEGLIANDSERLRFTAKGLLLSDILLPELVP
jgi:oxygen-independent coproporphyrinogen-3 oxidase